jgi:hypothetical protein
VDVGPYVGLLGLCEMGFGFVCLLRYTLGKEVVNGVHARVRGSLLPSRLPKKARM